MTTVVKDDLIHPAAFLRELALLLMIGRRICVFNPLDMCVNTPTLTAMALRWYPFRHIGVILPSVLVLLDISSLVVDSVQ